MTQQSRGPRIVVEIDEAKRNKFKLKAMLEGKDMRQVLLEYIDRYLETKTKNILDD